MRPKDLVRRRAAPVHPTIQRYQSADNRRDAGANRRRARITRDQGWARQDSVGAADRAASQCEIAHIVQAKRVIASVKRKSRAATCSSTDANTAQLKRGIVMTRLGASII